MITDFITISEARNSYLEFQYEYNLDFEKLLKSNVPNKCLRFEGIEKDNKFNRIIKYTKMHKKYWRRVNKQLLNLFVNCWALKNGKTINLKTMEEVLNGEINFI